MTANELWSVDRENYKQIYIKTVQRAPVDLPKHVVDRLSTPEAIALPHMLLDQPIRLLIMGQETRGNDQPLSGSSGYQAWAAQIGGFISFDYAYGGDPRQMGGRFWTAFEEVRQAFDLPSRRAIAWSNLVKVQLLDSVHGSNSVAKLSAEERMAVVRWQRELFRAEIDYIRPGAILFLTGHLHWVLSHMLESCETVPKGDFSVVTIEGFNIPMVQTRHPGAHASPAVLGEARRAAVAYLIAQLRSASAGAAEQWSDKLRGETRAAIDAGGVLSPDGRLHFKHIGGAFGFIEEADLWTGLLKLVDKKTGAETVFADVDELIRAGWAVD